MSDSCLSSLSSSSPSVSEKDPVVREESDEDEDEEEEGEGDCRDCDCWLRFHCGLEPSSGSRLYLPAFPPGSSWRKMFLWSELEEGGVVSGGGRCESRRERREKDMFL